MNKRHENFCLRMWQYMIRGCSGHVESKGAGVLVAVIEMLSQKKMTPPHICIVNSCHPGHT